MKDTNCKVVSKATLSRLPMYYRYLKEQNKVGEKTISSVKMAEDLRLNPVQVRKDLSCISSVSGKPKTGFDIEELIKDLSAFLNYDNTTDAIIVGVGQLGKTLLSYSGFDNYGLNIIAGFDINEDLCNKKINEKLVMNISKLEDFIKRTNTHIGIITVPREAAQTICDKLIESGIKAIWNFAPVHIQVPEGVIIKNEDIASSLAMLSRQLNDLYYKEAKK